MTTKNGAANVDGDRRCEGCGAPLDVIEAMRWSVCYGCTVARARTVAANGRCLCGRKQNPAPPVTARVRVLHPCRRCLGEIATQRVARSRS